MRYTGHAAFHSVASGLVEPRHWCVCGLLKVADCTVLACYNVEYMHTQYMCVGAAVQGTPVFNAPTLSAKGLLQFAQGVLVLRKTYRSMLSPPMFDSPRAIRWEWRCLRAGCAGCVICLSRCCQTVLSP